MATKMDILTRVVQVNGLNVSKTIAVPIEDAYSTNQVKHVCRNGLTLLNKQFYEFTYPINQRGGMQRAVCNLWNCAFCGKTYYSVEQEALNYYQ